MEFVRKAIALSHTFIILIVVAIAFTCHNEWQEVEALEVGNRHIDEFRKEVNRIHIQLIEFSLLGETALDWDETDLENYHAQRIALDSTLCLFNETHVIGRIDSVRSLLEDKERQMFQIVRLIDEQPIHQQEDCQSSTSHCSDKYAGTAQETETKRVLGHIRQKRGNEAADNNNYASFTQ